MRAVWVREFGPPEVLVPGDAPDLRPGEGQVVVAVQAVGVPFVETMVRAGTAPMPGPRLPVIPGNGMGGVVVGAGAGVDGAVVGRRVVTSTGGSGAYAEAVAVAVDADALIPVADRRVRVRERLTHRGLDRRDHGPWVDGDRRRAGPVAADMRDLTAQALAEARTTLGKTLLVP